MRTAIALLFLVAACSDPPPTVIDGSSPEAFERTTAAARRDIPAADRLVFDRALHTVASRHFGNDAPEARARVTFDGMTAEQVVEDMRARDAGRTLPLDVGAQRGDEVTTSAALHGAVTPPQPLPIEGRGC